MHIHDVARRAKDAAWRLSVLPTETKNQVLEAIAITLLDYQTDILTANQHDVERTSDLVRRGARPSPSSTVSHSLPIRYKTWLLECAVSPACPIRWVAS